MSSRCQRVPAAGTSEPYRSFLQDRQGPPIPTAATKITLSVTDGVGNHWWRKLQIADYTSHQLPDTAGRYTKPAGW